MRISTLILLALFSIRTYGQDTKPAFDAQTWVAPYTLPTPEGWGVERFLIPIGFTSQLPYKGVEDIRFAPGWGKAKSEEYWSYAFLWYLDGKIQMDETTIAKNLKTYYLGLIEVNSDNLPFEKLIPILVLSEEVKRNKGDRKTFAGFIIMTDYMSLNPIHLNFKAHLTFCKGENKSFIFYEISPQPLNHSVWLSLDKLWLDFSSKKH